MGKWWSCMKLEAYWLEIKERILRERKGGECSRGIQGSRLRLRVHGEGLTGEGGQSGEVNGTGEIPWSGEVEKIQGGLF
jgi:hypothetical protein